MNHGAIPGTARSPTDFILPKGVIYVTDLLGTDYVDERTYTITFEKSERRLQKDAKRRQRKKRK